MVEPTEDIPYEIDDMAISVEEDKRPDPDNGRKRKSVLKQLSEELEHDIQTNNSFDVIQLPANAKPEDKIAAFDQMAIHKGLALHLQKYKVMIDNKLKELK